MFEQDATLYADCSMPSSDYVTNNGTAAAAIDCHDGNALFDHLIEAPTTTTTTFDYFNNLGDLETLSGPEKIAAAPSNSLAEPFTQSEEPIADECTALYNPVVTQQGQDHLVPSAVLQQLLATPHQDLPLGTPTTDCVSSPYTPAVFGSSPVVNCWDLDLHSPAFSVGTPYSTAVNTPYSAAPNLLQINDITDSSLYAGIDTFLEFGKDSPVLTKSHSGFAALEQIQIGFVNPVDVMHDPEVADSKPVETKAQTQAAQQAAGDPASGSTTPLPPPDTPSTTTTTGTPESHMPQTYVSASAPSTLRTGNFTPRPTPVPIRPRPATEEADRPIKRRKSSSEEDDGDTSAGGDKKLYPCPKCSRMFGRKFNMQTHLSTHDPNRVKPFECDHPGCGSKFTRKHDLKRHINGIHKGEKVYECSDCQKPFSRKDAWKRHQANCGK